MIETDLGKVVLLPVGNWNSTSTYSFLDIVASGGESFIAKKAVPAGTTTNDTEYWQVLASPNGISGIEKISTSDLVDTYRMSFDNGTHYDYQVTNGRSLYYNFEVSVTTGDLYVEYLGE